MIGIDYAIGALSTLADDAIKRIWPDATEVEKAKVAQVSQEIQNQFSLQMGQIDVNKIEAAHQSIFVAGWRPFLGWVCGGALIYGQIIQPAASFIAMVKFGYSGPFPAPPSELWELMMGLLGLAGLRSFERTRK